MKELRSRSIGLWVLSLFVVAAFGCSPAPEPPAPVEPADDAPPPAAVDAPEPPGGGDIIVDPNGWSLGGAALASVTDSTVWIPDGFTGGASSVSFNPGGGQNPVAISAAFHVDFPSGAGIQLTPGNPATWQCRASSSETWAACATRTGTEIPSSLAPTAGTSSASVVVGSNSYPMSSGASLTIR